MPRFFKLNQYNIRFPRNSPFLLPIALILLFTQTPEANATDYYFSSTEGNDNRTSIEAQNPSTPWQSISTLNDFFEDLKPGDRILFKRGDTFYGNILINGSGITLSSYGEGDKPIITGMKKIDQWKNLGEGIYSTTLESMESKELSVVLLQGEIQELGRYPNSNAANGGYLMSHSETAGKISGPPIPFNAKGAEIVLRKNNWIIDRFPVDSHEKDTFVFTDDSIYPATHGYGFFIQKSLATLDQFGEWYYDPLEKLLYMFFGEQNPSQQIVEVALIENLVTMKDKTARLAIKLEELDFKGANQNILDLNRVFDIQIKKCDIRYAGRDGIYLYETPSTLIEENSFKYCLNNSIFFWYGGTKAQVRGNSIMHTMPYAGMSQNSDLNGIGIYMAADSDGSIIEENQIINTGYMGIYFGGDHVVVRKNLIDDFCRLKFDGGGIYTNSQGLLDRNQTDRLVEHNIVVNGKGTPHGTPLQENLAEGIYLDDDARGLTIRNNTVANLNSRGIYLHNARNIKIEGNILFNNKYDIYLSHDQYGNPITDLEISGNYFLSKDKNYRFFGISSISDDISEMGKINDNYYLDPFSTNFQFQDISVSRHTLTDRNLSDWSQTYGFDSLSKYTDFKYKEVEISHGKILKESDFSNGIEIIAGTYKGSSTLKRSGISDSMLQVTTQENDNTTLFIQIGKIGIGDQILVESESSMNRENKKASIFLERTQKANPSAFTFGFAGTRDFSQNETLLTSTINSNNESVVIRIPSHAAEVLFKKIKISKVTVAPLKIEEKILFKYNYSDKIVSHELPGVYIDGKGEQFSGLVDIPPYSAKLLVKVD